MPIAVQIAIAVVCVVAANLLLFQFAARWLVGYKIGRSGIDVLLFHFIPVLRIGYRYIADIEVLNRRESPAYDLRTFLTLRLSNRVWGGFVLVTMRKWIGFKYAILSPDNASDFVAEVRGRLSPP